MLQCTINTVHSVREYYRDCFINCSSVLCKLLNTNLVTEPQKWPKPQQLLNPKSLTLLPWILPWFLWNQIPLCHRHNTPSVSNSLPRITCLGRPNFTQFSTAISCNTTLMGHLRLQQCFKILQLRRWNRIQSMQCGSNMINYYWVGYCPDSLRKFFHMSYV